MSMYRVPRSAWSKLISTSCTVIRGSHISNAYRTSEAIAPAVDALIGANTCSWTRHPNSGRIGRSPGAVARISLIASSISRSRTTRATPPVASVASGKAHPAPTKSIPAMSVSRRSARWVRRPRSARRRRTGRRSGRPDHPGVSGRIPDPGSRWHTRHVPLVDLDQRTLDGHDPAGLDLGARLTLQLGRAALERQLAVGLHVHAPATAVDLDAVGGGDRHLAALEFQLAGGGVDHDPTLALDQDLAVAVHGDLGIHRVHLQLQLVARGGQRDALGAAVLVDQVDAVATPGDEGPPVDRAGAAVDQVGLARRRGVDSVVQAAEHVRPPDVALLEQHQHLVADLRQHHGAAVLARSRLHGAGPVADVAVGQPREGQLHPALFERVLGVADLADDGSLTQS